MTLPMPGAEQHLFLETLNNECDHAHRRPQCAPGTPWFESDNA